MFGTVMKLIAYPHKEGRFMAYLNKGETENPVVSQDAKLFDDVTYIITIQTALIDTRPGLRPFDLKLTSVRFRANKKTVQIRCCYE